MRSPHKTILLKFYHLASKGRSVRFDKSLVFLAHQLAVYHLMAVETSFQYHRKNSFLLTLPCYNTVLLLSEASAAGP